MKNLVGVLAVALMGVAASSAQAADLTGTWVVDGVTTVTVTKDSETMFTGKYGKDTMKLTVTGNSVRAKNDGGNVYNGTLEPDGKKIVFNPDTSTGALKVHTWKRKE